MSQSAVVSLQRPQELFHVFPFRMFIGGAGGRNNRQCLRRRIGTYFLLRHVDQRTYQPNPGARQFRDGGKATDASFIEQIEHEGFHHVIEVMSQRNGGTSVLACRTVQCTPAHLGTQ